MPRKALAPVRAALRFAHQATDEFGTNQTCRRGIGTFAGVSPEERPNDQRLRQQPL